MSSLLLVEDDENLSSMLKDRLSEEGYLVARAGTGAEARRLFSERKFDLVVLDVGLPDESGFSVATAFREASRAPIIFLTAMNSAEYRLEGYEIGAEDYIPKPFHLRELLLRIQRVLERSKISPVVSSAGISLDLEGRTLSFDADKSKHELSFRECEVLRMLIEASPKSVSREELHRKISGEGSSVSNIRSIDNAVVRLRGLMKERCFGSIRSIRGIGYVWEEESR